MNKLVKNAAIFVFGDILNKAIPFLLLPVLTRYLSTEDYGIIAIFNVLVAVTAVFTGINVHGAINVNYFKMKKEQLKEYIGNCLIILKISTIILLLIGYILYPMLIEKMNISFFWFFLSIIVASLQFLTLINLNLWIVEESPNKYSIYQVLQTLCLASLSLIFVVGLGMNYEGRLLSIVLGTALFSFISIGFIVKRGYLVFKVNKQYVRDALNFGIPLIPHQLSGWIKTGLDRMIIAATLGASITGVYSVAYQVSMLVDVIMASFNKVWGPYIMRTLSEDASLESKKKIVKITYALFLGIFSVALTFSFLAKFLIPIFLGKEFISASNYILYFSIAFAFGGMYYLVVPYLFYTKKTSYLSLATSFSAVIHLLFLYILTKKNGAVGASQASIISFFSAFVVSWYFSAKVYDMPWIFWKIKNNAGKVI